MDHKPEIEEKCMPKCEKFVAAYEACAERIQGDETGEAHCTVSTKDAEGGSRAGEKALGGSKTRCTDRRRERKTDWWDFFTRCLV